MELQASKGDESDIERRDVVEVVFAEDDELMMMEMEWVDSFDTKQGSITGCYTEKSSFSVFPSTWSYGRFSQI